MSLKCSWVEWVFCFVSNHLRYPWRVLFERGILNRFISMPKDKNVHISSSRKSRLSPPYSKKKELNSANSDTSSVKDWLDAVCPICMNSPHNAVLLLCTSYKSGCRPYICDTSYRHSHCFSQFLKHTKTDDFFNTTEQLGHLSDTLEIDDMLGTNTDMRVYVKKVESDNLHCPLCRRQVKGWLVVKAARKYLNKKIRSCATESCIYEGDYKQLRRHARTVHPFTRPHEIDPDRQLEWERREQESNIADVRSIIEATGGLLDGDYVVDDNFYSSDEGNWRSFLLFIQHLDLHSGVTIRATIPTQINERNHNIFSTLTMAGDDFLGFSDASLDDSERHSGLEVGTLQHPFSPTGSHRNENSSNIDHSLSISTNVSRSRVGRSTGNFLARSTIRRQRSRPLH